MDCQQTYTTPDEMKKFFKRLLLIKSYVHGACDAEDSYVLEKIYEMLDDLIKDSDDEVDE